MKHLLIVIAACLVCLNALAGSDIKVKSGKSVVVKENANAVIVWRTRQTLWGAKQMLTQKLCCQTIHDCQKVSTFAL